MFRILIVGILSMVCFQDTGIAQIPEMVFVEGGSFDMGCLSGRDDVTSIACQPDEGPAHKVYLGDFLISKYEITNSLYAAIMDDVPSFGLVCGLDCPVNRANFYDVVIYCNELTVRDQSISDDQRVYYIDPDFTTPWTRDDHYQISNALLYDQDVYVDVSKIGYRIPTEAEWEYAARGGQMSQGFVYSGSNVLDDVAWVFSNSGGAAQLTGLKLPNELGIYDMSGNVNEWCWDAYAEFSGNPQCGALSESIAQWQDFHQSQFCCPIVRGGSFNMTNIQSRCAFRNNNLVSTSENFDVGVRIVRTVNHRPIPFDVDITDPSCFMATDGGISITNPSRGVPGYTIAWLDDLSTDWSRVGLAAGEYTMRISDSFVCSFEESFVVNQIPEIIIDVTDTTNPTCFQGNDGTASATILSNVHQSNNLEFIWSEAINNSTGSMGQAENLLADSTYWVYASDGLCDSDTVYFSLNNPSPIMLDGSNTIINVASCVGGCDSYVMLSASGGSGTLNYNYEWDDGSTERERFDLCAGDYNITLVDNSGCRQAVSLTIPESTLISLLIDDVLTEPENCNVLGSAVVISSGAQGNVDYSIDNGSIQADNNFNDLPQGNYLFLIRDANNCSDSIEVQVNIDLSPEIENVLTVDESCDSDNGSVLINTMNGIAPLEFKLDGMSFQNENDFSNLDSGDYTAFVIDDNGCTDSLDFSILRLPSPRITQIDTIAERCEQNDGVIEIFSIDGVSPISFSIDGGATFQTNPIFDNLNGDSYDIVIRDANGCIDQQQTFIDHYPSPILLGIENIDFDCSAENGSFAVLHESANGAFAYTLDNNIVQSDSIFTNLMEGNYTIEITDQEGCTDVESFNFEDLTCPSIYIPNVFNPSALSDNRSFKIFQSSGHNVVIMDYEIYDRWGNKVYAAYDFEIAKGNDIWWRGAANGKIAPNGVYTYSIKVALQIGVSKVYQGNVTLIR